MAKKNDYLIIGVVVLALAFATGMINLGTPGAVGGQQPGGAAGAGGAAAVSCPTIVSQTLQNKTYDFAKRTSAVVSDATVYLNAANGEPYPGGLSTQQLGTYDVLNTASNYFSTLVHTTTSCSATPSEVGYLKGVDTPTVVVKNSDAQTTNADANNLTIGASGSGTVHLKMSQTTAYKYLTGDSGKFCILMNATNTTDWNAGQSSAVFNGVPCVPYAQGGLANSVVPAALTNAYVMGFVCTGDFQANDGNIYDLAVKIQAASGVNPGLETIGLNYVGADYYKDTINGKVGIGCGKDDASAIQTLRNYKVQIE